MSFLNQGVEVWLKGLFAAIIGAIANSGVNMVAAPDQFNFSHAGLVLLAKTAGASALLALFMYLKQSPLPQEPK